jgi:hypothetical protein
LLAFLDNAPLTAEEQKAVRNYLAAAMTAHPAALGQGVQQVAQAVDMLGHHDPQADALVRQMYRGAIEALPEGDTERRIVDAHDKTIAFNPQNRLIISEHTIGVIIAAAQWAARALGKPAPGDDLASDVRSVLASQFLTFDQANQEGFAHIEGNMAVAMPLLSHAPPEEQRAALLKWGSVDDDHALVRAAISTFEYQAFKISLASGNGGFGNALMMHQLTDRQMQQNAWSMRHPECGPLGGHPSTCGQAPIMQPITPPPF